MYQGPIYPLSTVERGGGGGGVTKTEYRLPVNTVFNQPVSYPHAEKAKIRLL